MFQTKMSRIATVATTWIFVVSLHQALLAQEKNSLSKEESAEVIKNRIPTANKDSEGRVRRLFIPLKRLTDLTALRECPHLWYLDAAWNHLTSLEGLENCKELRNLNLNRNKLTNLDGIEKLSKLETLALFGNDLADISHLGKLKNLKFLVLTGNPDLTATQITALEKSLPDCEIVFESKHEQVGARQSATAVDSKSEASENPEPESEGLSQ